MNRAFLLSGTAALALAALPHAAQAQITAAEAWSQWQDYFERTGYAVSGTEDIAGDMVTVTDLTLVQRQEDDEGVLLTTLAFSQIVFTGADDGTVTIDFPDRIPLTVEGTDDTGSFTVGLGITLEGDRTTVSGDADSAVYETAIDRATMQLEELLENGAPVTDIDVMLTAVIEAFDSRTEISGSDPLTYAQTQSADSLTLSVSFDDTVEGATGTFDGRMNELTGEGAAAIPEGPDSDDMAAMVAGGMSVLGRVAFGSGESNLDMADDSGRITLRTQSGGGAYDVSVDASGLRLSLGQTDLAFDFQTMDFPLPLEGTIARHGFDVTVPVTPSPDPQDFAMRILAQELALGDTIWNMFDPAAILPRDPATLEIDLAGQAISDESLFDPAGLEDDADAMDPGAAFEDLRALDIRALKLSAAGAEVTGDGAFAHNPQADAQAGLPPLVGTLNLRIAGANGLLDRLIQAGFLGQDDAMGARMMMGMLGVPGEAPDTLTSTIEINEEGHISANGQRLR